MEAHSICIMLLQETWTGTSPDKREFEDKHDGNLFLLHGNKKPKGKKCRNQCGMGFILSPTVCKAWAAAGQEPIRHHKTNDNLGRIGNIKLRFNKGKSKPKNYYFVTAYAPNSNYEQSYLYKDFISNLSDAIVKYSKDNTIIIGGDFNCKLGQINTSTPLDEGEKTTLTLGHFNLSNQNKRGQKLNNFFTSSLRHRNVGNLSVTQV